MRRVAVFSGAFELVKTIRRSRSTQPFELRNSAMFRLTAIARMNPSVDHRQNCSCFDVRLLRNDLTSEHIRTSTHQNKHTSEQTQGRTNTHQNKHTSEKIHIRTSTHQNKHTSEQTHIRTNTHQNKHTSEQTHIRTNTHQNKHTSE